MRGGGDVFRFRPGEIRLSGFESVETSGSLFSNTCGARVSTDAHTWVQLWYSLLRRWAPESYMSVVPVFSKAEAPSSCSWVVRKWERHSDVRTEAHRGVAEDDVWTHITLIWGCACRGPRAVGADISLIGSRSLSRGSARLLAGAAAIFSTAAVILPDMNVCRRSDHICCETSGEESLTVAPGSIS